MNKALVVYNSQTGFTRRYAQWLAAALGAPCVPYAQRGSLDLAGYDTVIFGSWCHAGSVLKKKWLLEQCARYPDKRFFAFAVGASSAQSPDIPLAMAANFPEGCRVQAFYLPGGLNYEKMGFTSRLMMKMLVRFLNAKKDKTPEETEAARMMAQNYDLSDESLLAPLLEAIRA